MGVWDGGFLTDRAQPPGRMRGSMLGGTFDSRSRQAAVPATVERAFALATTDPPTPTSAHPHVAQEGGLRRVAETLALASRQFMGSPSSGSSGDSHSPRSPWIAPSLTPSLASPHGAAASAGTSQSVASAARDGSSAASDGSSAGARLSVRGAKVARAFRRRRHRPRTRGAAASPEPSCCPTSAPCDDTSTHRNPNSSRDGTSPARTCARTCSSGTPHSSAAIDGTTQEDIGWSVASASRRPRTGVAPPAAGGAGPGARGRSLPSSSTPAGRARELKSDPPQPRTVVPRRFRH